MSAKAIAYFRAAELALWCGYPQPFPWPVVWQTEVLAFYHMPVWYEVFPFDEDTPLDVDEIANPREVPWHRVVRVWQDHTSWWHMSAKPEWEI